MEDPYCPNFSSCQLINGQIAIAESNKEKYISLFCIGPLGKWQACKRFSTKEQIGFCPDFVLPDTNLTLEEIIEKFDNT